MANTKVTVKKVTFKIEPDYTLAEVEFETDNEPMLGNVRWKKFPPEVSVMEILNTDLKGLGFMSWPNWS